MKEFHTKVAALVYQSMLLKRCTELERLVLLGKPMNGDRVDQDLERYYKNRRELTEEEQGELDRREGLEEQLWEEVYHERNGAGKQGSGTQRGS